MLKYRLLTNQELNELEEEFKHFLIVNQIYDDEWRRINREKSEKVKALIEFFSNVVFEKALKKINFLEVITPTGINAFHCKPTEMELIGISSNNNTVDFNKLSTNTDFNQYQLNIFKTSKPYNKTREIEVFDLLESGCGIISEERYNKLKLAYNFSAKKNKN